MTRVHKWSYYWVDVQVGVVQYKMVPFILQSGMWTFQIRLVTCTFIIRIGIRWERNSRLREDYRKSYYNLGYSLKLFFVISLNILSPYCWSQDWEYWPAYHILFPCSNFRVTLVSANVLAFIALTVLNELQFIGLNITDIPIHPNCNNG